MDPSPSIDLAPVLARVRATGVTFDEARLQAAFNTASEIYGNTPHWTGLTLLEHVLGVLDVLLPFEPDEDAIIACLLHHALESRNITLPELETQFGSKVRSLVSSVHLLSHVTLEHRRTSIDDLRLMLLSVSDDVRTILITLCERCTLLKYVDRLPSDDAKRLCQDVLHLFAPVAARLGIYTLKHEMENRAFPLMYPSDAERIIEQMEQLKREQGDFLLKTALTVRQYLRDHGIDALVDAREKHPYSIFAKIRAKSLSHVTDVHDLFALRAVVRTEADCYQTLGFLHQIGRPVPNRFKDYIAFPKPNGYQSLHTTIAELPGVPASTLIEIQVRTAEMHREAQYGVAAHWSYKEHGTAAQAAERIQLEKLLVTQHPIEDNAENSFADHIFVLTPRGDIVELPEGATPLDFAFQVHTDLGLSFRTAKVNGAVVSLEYQLENGDIVEIEKRRLPQPSPQWMQLLKMASSRSKLKRYLYAQDRPRLIAQGRGLLNEALLSRGLAPLDPDLTILRRYDGADLPFIKREDVLMKIGQGAERTAATLTHLDALKKVLAAADREDEEEQHVMIRSGEGITIAGGVPMPLRFAKCCKPGEDSAGPIIGVISRSGEVVVHRKVCRMFKNSSPGRRIDLWWRDEGRTRGKR